MPTLAQLRSEPWWDREIVTDEVDWLGDELCRRTGRPRVAFGSKGNEAHSRGAHRSQEWILNSRYCTSRSYTVQSGLSALQQRHVAGADFTPGDWGTSANRALMVEQTNRLVSTLKAGRLPGVREVIGTLNGRTVIGTRADGSTFSSDDSHLEHWHLTLDRRRCADRSVMERIIAVALGEDDDMTPEQAQQLRDSHYTLAKGINNPAGEGSVPLHVWAEWVTGMVKAIAAGVDIDADELARIEAAAKAGAASAADSVVARVLAGLPEGTLTRDDVAAALREVLLTGAGPQA